MVVIDASVAAKWVLVEDYSENAIRLRLDVTSRDEPIAAPSLLFFELTNILRQRVRQGNMSLPDADRLLTDLLAFPIRIGTPDGLYRQALAIADTYGLPATYDAHYVALAQLLNCDLWTDDRRLLRALDGRLTFVRWIGDYVAEPTTPP